jgi:hypothetical protein
MRTIIIGDTIYKVTEREFGVITQMKEDAMKQATMGHKQSFFADDKLNEYLEAAKITYKCVGTVDFQIHHP